MDKNAIKKFAVWARRELISRVTQKALQFGISETGYGEKYADSVNGILLSAEQKKQRSALIEKIEQYGGDKNAYEQVIEEVAYTWFNRFTALRFMEVNGYLPTHIRVFTDDNNEFKPQILTEAIHIELEGLKQQVVFKLKEENKEDELYKYLLITQCNALNSFLPVMFQKIADYTELLFPDNLLREGSVIDRMIADIPEGDWNVGENGQVEIIGWLYQYYISEKHEEVVDPLHGKTIKKEDVPAATQLFTADWVVRYITDNSVGRYWIERNPESTLASQLQYFIKGKDGISFVNESINPKELTVFDPCVGSGHFLVYAFEVLIKIYNECGYSTRDAVRSIVENNLYGLDIDERATQLAYFAVMMKACAYDSRFLARGIQPHIYAIRESNDLDQHAVAFFCNGDKKLTDDLMSILNDMADAKEYGSILQIKPVDFDALYARFEEIKSSPDLLAYMAEKELLPIVRVAELLSKKYKTVITNPPYLNKYSAKLKGYIESNYADYKGDLFSVFMYRNFGFCEKDGYTGFMTPFVWMFIKTYEKLRNYIIGSKSITSLIQMEYSAYDEATVPICSFVLKNGKETSKGLYLRLSAFVGSMEVQRQKVLEALNSADCEYFYEADDVNFAKIPGCPIAYWISGLFASKFSESTVENFYYPKFGISTGDGEKFIRFWHEVCFANIKTDCQKTEEWKIENKAWCVADKGGVFRRWYGNKYHVMWWKDNGKEIKAHPKSAVRNPQFFFLPHISWTLVTSGAFSARIFDSGYLVDTASNSIYYTSKSDKFFALALLNSKVCNVIFQLLNPTINMSCGVVANVPYIVPKNIEIIDLKSEECVALSKKDWDSFETSWDFKKHPLLCGKRTIQEAYAEWESECNERFNSLKANEEELNRIFIDIYGLQDELTPEVEDKDITVRKADLQREIKSLISYAVGCMFGRYSLYKEGLIYAGGEFDFNSYIDFAWQAGHYSDVKEFYSQIHFTPDEDGIIPICDDEYFADDIVGKFVEFVELVYGSDTLEENLTFIANALGGSGSARDVIRDYFNNGFYADHLKVYQKRPIYWLFDSGKKGGFKALVYMHRYKPDTIARMRTDYVHEQQARYRAVIEDLERRLGNASTSERVKLNKQLIKVQAQADELLGYEEKIHHLADQMISIDLDDGVAVNYAKFQDVLAKIK